MIIRVVRMQFTEQGVEEFLAIFNRHQHAIRHFPGCLHLELWRAVDDEGCFVTYSHWQRAEDLEHYRTSDLFATVWGQVKTLFRERPQAFSVERDRVVG
ncbi:MAG: antibiotic biosynthesis monooxygenase [Cyclobacteriaceae bacterium]|jgi:quinol monooxygenase YgiN|nr:antibiotic biosynthesis monooxygenase [Cyclobacteriaceae bacterium]